MCPKSFLALYHPVPGVKIAGTTQRKVSGGGPFRGTLHIRFRVAVHLFSNRLQMTSKCVFKKKKKKKKLVAHKPQASVSLK